MKKLIIMLLLVSIITIPTSARFSRDSERYSYQEIDSMQKPVNVEAQELEFDYTLFLNYINQLIILLSIELVVIMTYRYLKQNTPETYELYPLN